MAEHLGTLEVDCFVGSVGTKRFTRLQVTVYEHYTINDVKNAIIVEYAALKSRLLVSVKLYKDHMVELSDNHLAMVLFAPALPSPHRSISRASPSPYSSPWMTPLAPHSSYSISTAISPGLAWMPRTAVVTVTAALGDPKKLKMRINSIRERLEQAKRMHMTNTQKRNRQGSPDTDTSSGTYSGKRLSKRPRLEPLPAAVDDDTSSQGHGTQESGLALKSQARQRNIDHSDKNDATDQNTTGISKSTLKDDSNSNRSVNDKVHNKKEMPTRPAETTQERSIKKAEKKDGDVTDQKDEQSGDSSSESESESGEDLNNSDDEDSSSESDNESDEDDIDVTSKVTQKDESATTKGKVDSQDNRKDDSESDSESDDDNADGDDESKVEKKKEDIKADKKAANEDNISDGGSESDSDSDEDTHSAQDSDKVGDNQDESDTGSDGDSDSESDTDNNGHTVNTDSSGSNADNQDESGSGSDSDDSDSDSDETRIDDNVDDVMDNVTKMVNTASSSSHDGNDSDSTSSTVSDDNSNNNDEHQHHHEEQQAIDESMKPDVEQNSVLVEDAGSKTTLEEESETQVVPIEMDRSSSNNSSSDDSDDDDEDTGFACVVDAPEIKEISRIAPALLRKSSPARRLRPTKDKFMAKLATSKLFQKSNSVSPVRKPAISKKRTRIKVSSESSKHIASAVKGDTPDKTLEKLLNANKW